MVYVGDVGIGGEHPIRVQSMTTTDTQDVRATVAQVERLARAGCEIVRITAPSKRDAESLGAIKKALLDRGISVPLVADIHFTPNAALIAAEHVEKVRINPGNYADRKRFEVREYSDAQYREELERVAERFRPLVRRCQELGRAMRIGTNHGSLSDRIVNRYGDTPRGMVESALEFLDVCEAEGFRDVVFSMKASNPQVAIHAYRLLATRLEDRGRGEPAPPFHVGVTEAGSGEDGRVKSAIGIGALLEDGIGDTIRVSLTEDPVREVPVARALARHYEARWRTPLRAPRDPGAPYVDDVTSHARRRTRVVGEIGGNHPVRVEASLGAVPADAAAAAEQVAEELRRLGALACEGLLVDVADPADVDRLGAFGRALDRVGSTLPLAVRAPAALARSVAPLAARVVVVLDRAGSPPPSDEAVPWEWSLAVQGDDLLAALDGALSASGEPAVVSVETSDPVPAVRLLVARLRARGCGDVPVALRHRADAGLAPETALLHAAADLGGLLCDGIGDVVSVGGFGSLERDVRAAYRILQGSRLRTSWTEFISCPSCGRTLFDLEETTARIQARTRHLPGLKIAVMGCIVNGPGEMADADFGYVGSGPGVVNLYVGHECVVRNVPAAQAPDRLVELIRAHGRWVDP